MNRSLVIVFCIFGLIGCSMPTNNSSPQVTPVIPTTIVSTNIGTMQYVPGGTFQRDSTTANLSTVDSFYIGVNLVTRDQFSKIMGIDPSATSISTSINDPVQQVNWYQAIAFCNKLSLKEGLTPVYTVSGINFSNLKFSDIPNGGTQNVVWNAASYSTTANGYRLATEMEYMWAAMGALSDSITADISGGINIGGYAKAFAGSNGGNLLNDYAWTTANSNKTTHPVGNKKANELGLYDMSGNVWTWCWDWNDVYPSGTVKNYLGASSGNSRIKRGGAWDYATSYAAISSRDNNYPYYQLVYIGVRLARNIK